MTGLLCHSARARRPIVTALIKVWSPACAAPAFDLFEQVDNGLRSERVTSRNSRFPFVVIVRGRHARPRSADRPYGEVEPHPASQATRVPGPRGSARQAQSRRGGPGLVQLAAPHVSSPAFVLTRCLLRFSARRARRGPSSKTERPPASRVRELPMRCPAGLGPAAAACGQRIPGQLSRQEVRRAALPDLPSDISDCHQWTRAAAIQRGSTWPSGQRKETADNREGTNS